MREIIFRGKRPDNGEWVEGDLYHNFIYNGESKKETRMGNIYFYGCKIHGTAFNMVDPETVGQFTGLEDKNGKRIFEGDIIKNEYSQGIFRKFSVSYDGVIGCWIATYKNTSPHFLYNLIGKIEIIGNIHDNPELLEREGRE